MMDQENIDMTDQEAIDIILYKAKKFGLDKGLKDPRICIQMNYSNPRACSAIYLIQYGNDDYSPVFIMRLLLKSNLLRTLVCSNDRAYRWCKEVKFAELSTKLPKFVVKPFVSYVKAALSNPNLSIDAFSIASTNRIELICKSKTYAEAMVELDMERGI